MLRAARNDSELVSLEHAGFGVSHDALGAALCESWGLGAAAVASVRHHVAAQATLRLPAGACRRSICALSVMARCPDGRARRRSTRWRRPSRRRPTSTRRWCCARPQVRSSARAAERAGLPRALALTRARRRRRRVGPLLREVLLYAGPCIG
jgi:hypothetical protein